MKSSKTNSRASSSPKKQEMFSLLTQILTESKDKPIRPPDYPKVPDSGPPGVLINIDYQGDAGLAKVKIYNATKGEIYEWLDNTGHHPYCLTDLTREDVSQRNAVVGHSGFLKLEESPKYNLLLDKEQQYTVVVAKDPLAIGGRPNSIREKLGRDHSWEADIRYTQCYTMDRTLTPGLLYRVQDKGLVPVPQEFSTEDATKIRKLFAKDKELSKLIEEYLPLFLTQATYLPRLALDIEVESEFIDRIPDPETAPQPVISVSIVDDIGTGRVYMLRRDADDLSESKLPETVKIEFFDEERTLLETVFRVIWRAPLLITFNGDNFDLRYLVNRAKKLNIPALDIPIRMRGGFRGNPEASLEYGVHIDLYRFFHNRSIQIYAFRNRYQEVRLENLSQALLGEGKLQLPDQISKIPTHLLAEYNWQDSHLTMRLSQFDNDLVMNLILLLMRLSHQGLHDLTRTAVSNWIRSLLYYAHRQNNYLIPRQDEISAFKGEAVTEAIIKGKKYMGAIVVEPKEGVHFNVMLMDFASLYPSIMKAYNLSYETVRCDHPECKENIVPETPHWVCTRREGITSQLIGLIRDVRVEHFKPHANDKTISTSQRNWFSVVEQALKVFLNACLPHDEEVFIRDSQGQISKKKISTLQNDWSDYEILSINSDSNNGGFGKPIFVPILGLAKTGTNQILKIKLADGRELRCTPNHVVPVFSTHKGRRYGRDFHISEIPAEEISIGDELLLCNKIPLSSSPPKRLFIPDLISSTPLLIGMRRDTYKRFSYRSSQTTENPLIQLVNQKSRYNKSQKIYRLKWDDLSQKEKDIIRRAKANLLVKISRKTLDPDHWQNISIPLTTEFFALMGWYLAEGHGQKNRITITQSKKSNPEKYQEIIRIIEGLSWPYASYGGKTITVHSNVLATLMGTLCGTHASNKRIPLRLLNKERALTLVESYFKGDGNFNRDGKRRYSTISPQLNRDLLTLLSGIGRFSSVHNDPNITRIVETDGRQYTRKYRGLMEFNGTNLVRVKSIITEPKPQPVFDVETGNGWFVTTNGVVTHNSYGVLGASHFPLYCAPAAESITALGRFAITQTIDKAKEIGVTVLYGDTDSLFLDNPTKAQLQQLIDFSEKELRVELDVEKEYRYVALSSRKKNYLGVSKDGQVDIKGLTGKKRNTPAFLQVAFMQMIDILRQVRNPDDFTTAKNRILKLAREKLTMLERREFKVEDLAIRVQVTKSLNAYVKTTPQHVKAARQLQKAGKEVVAGDIIAYVKTTGGVKPVEQATAQDIDITKYKDLVKSTFEQVLDALGIEWLDTIGMRRLDTFFG
jgi:DNA polymerase elongation subunit (family B)